MNIQDDYFDLHASLNAKQKNMLDRIWSRVDKLEQEVEEFRVLKQSVRQIFILSKD